MQALDKALVSLQARASVLRDGAIVSAQKIAEHVKPVINQVAVTGAIVDLTTKATLHQVEHLQRDTTDLKFHAEQSGVQLSSFAEGMKTFTTTQNTTTVKIDDVHAAQRTTHAKIDDIHGIQQAVHEKVETLSDVQQAKKDAAKAMEIALETAQCKSADPSCSHSDMQN